MERLTKQIAADDIEFSDDELKDLIAALKEHKKPLVEFARFLKRQARAKRDYFARLSEDSPTRLVELYLEWEKNPPSKDRKILRIRQTVTPEAEELLNQSNQRFQDSTLGLWDQMGGSKSVPELINLMIGLGNKTTSGSLSTMLRNQLNHGLLIGTRQNASKKSSWRVPIWQVDPDTGSIHSQVPELCKALSSNGPTALKFMLSESPVLNGMKPAAVLGNASDDRLLEAARSFIRSD